MMFNKYSLIKKVFPEWVGRHILLGRTVMMLTVLNTSDPISSDRKNFSNSLMQGANQDQLQLWCTARDTQKFNIIKPEEWHSSMYTPVPPGVYSQDGGETNKKGDSIILYRT